MKHLLICRRAAAATVFTLLAGGLPLAAQDLPWAPTQGFGSEAVADFDGDGLADRAVVDKDAITVTFQGHPGATAQVPVPGVQAVAALDLDGDRAVDLVSVDKDHQTTVWLNDKSGRFKAAASAKAVIDLAADDRNLFTLGEIFRNNPGALADPLPAVSKGGACDGVPANYRPAVCGYFHRLYCECIAGRLMRGIPPDSPLWRNFRGCGQFMDTMTDCKCWSVDYRKPADDQNCFSWLPKAGQ
jgi:hypothetical protein